MISLLQKGVLDMLKKFQVENYRGFKNTLLWDLSDTRDYGFRKNLIDNKIVKKSVVFGRNGSGKSSLCTAVVDITAHLLDAEKDDISQHLYTYVGNEDRFATFTYVFQFGKDEVMYTYCKANLTTLLFEAIAVNGKEMLVHNFIDEKDNFIRIPGAENLRTKGLQKQLSVVKYIYNNTIQDENSVISKIMKFVSGMLYFRSLRDANKYIGYKLGSEKLNEIILNNGRLEDFNAFINDMGLNYTLVPLKLMSGALTIGAKFENDKVVEFESIASSGTRTLMLFYCWFIEFGKLTFLVIDEFDAYYHHELSEKILSIIQSFDNMQSMVTTHNVTLLHTDCTRPDCAYVIENGSINNLSSLTKRELREAHNIEKLYRANEFERGKE
jgi:hypothetical protein